uniref:Uncharacterized protein n=1 Tax=Arundo donax TaxID=35708 RepID=A0A0A9AHR3_ARUDO
MNLFYGDTESLQGTSYLTNTCTTHANSEVHDSV